MRATPDMTSQRAQRLGLATFAALLLAIVGSWHGFAFLKHPLSTRLDGATAFWLMVDLAGAILGCALAVIYLRHIYRSSPAPANRTTWAMLILLLGPFAMPFYWWRHLRRVPTPPAHLVQMGLITEEEARLLAQASGQPGHLPVAVGVEDARAAPAPSVEEPRAPAAAGVGRDRAVASTSVAPPAPRGTA